MAKKTAAPKTFPIAPVQLDPSVALRRYQETFVKVAKTFYSLVELAKQGHGGPGPEEILPPRDVSLPLRQDSYRPR